MFRAARVLHGVSPFSIFLMEQKSNPQLTGVSIAKRAKLLSDMYKNLSGRQRKMLIQRAKAHPSFVATKADARASKKRSRPRDNNFAKFVKENYDKVRALNHRKRFVALSQLYELQKPVKIADKIIRVPITSAASAGSGDMTLKPTTTTAGSGACTIADDTSASKATTTAEAGGNSGTTTTTPTKTTPMTTTKSSSSRSHHARDKSKDKSKTSDKGHTRNSRGSSSGSSSSKSHASSRGGRAHKMIKQAARAAQTSKAATRPRGGKYLREGLAPRTYNIAHSRRYTRAKH